jgi:hypothetical protein
MTTDLGAVTIDVALRADRYDERGFVVVIAMREHG